MAVDLTDLRSAFTAARLQAKTDPTPENREAVKAAWAALDAAAPRQKVSGHASRAGKRQHDEFWSQYRR